MDKKNSHYECDLWSQLEGTVQEYEQDREKIWRASTPDKRIVFERSERFAQHIEKCTEQFFNTGRIDEDFKSLHYELLCFLGCDNGIQTSRLTELEELQAKLDNWDNSESAEREALIREVLELLQKEMHRDPEHDEESPLRLVRERLCIRYACRLVGEIEGCAKRTLKLYGLLLTVKPCLPTLSFLARLSRCYIWGFDPECVMLCRSVLDTAFREAVSDDLCEDHLGPRNDYTFLDRIVVSKKASLISQDHSELADTVRKRGNLAVHVRPDAIKDTWQTMKDTVEVLEALHLVGKL